MRSGRKRFAFDEFENEELNSVHSFKSMDCGDVGMVQCSQHSGFALESCESVRVLRELVRKSLDCDVTAKFRIACSPDLSHTSFTNGRKDCVVAKLNAGLHYHDLVKTAWLL